MTSKQKRSSRKRMQARHRSRRAQSPNMLTYTIDDIHGSPKWVKKPNRAMRKISDHDHRTANGAVVREEQRKARKRKLTKARRVLRKMRKAIKQAQRRAAAK
jgi:ribosomal protein L28